MKIIKLIIKPYTPKTSLLTQSSRERSLGPPSPPPFSIESVHGLLKEPVRARDIGGQRYISGGKSGVAIAGPAFGKDNQFTTLVMDLYSLLYKHIAAFLDGLFDCMNTRAEASASM